MTGRECADQISQVPVPDRRVQADLVVKLLLIEMGCGVRGVTGKLVVDIGRRAGHATLLKLARLHTRLQRLNARPDNAVGNARAKAPNQLARVHGTEATFANLLQESDVLRRDVAHVRLVLLDLLLLLLLLLLVVRLELGELEQLIALEGSIVFVRDG